MRVRVIPILLLTREGLYKTIRFSNPSYIGDPINAVKIFNEKAVDELVILDIQASKTRMGPDFDRIAEIASEAFMPMGYGGGIRTVNEIKKVVLCGFEKVIIGTAAFEDKELVRQGSKLVGSQSIVVSVDYKMNIFKKPRVYVRSGTQKTGIDPITYARQMEELGAGELIVQSIDRDGTFSGYDLDQLRRVSEAVSIPVVACGGASGIGDFAPAIRAGASAVAAGSLFVYRGKTRGILPNYPSQSELRSELFMKLQG